MDAIDRLTTVPTEKGKRKFPHIPYVRKDPKSKDTRVCAREGEAQAGGTVRGLAPRVALPPGKR